MTEKSEATIWIDLDNTPHVPFFAPIMEELRQRGYSVFVTARDAFQVRELADFMQIRYSVVGRHYGRKWIFKAFGNAYRGVQLVPHARRAKVNLAVSHGSRSQLVASTLLDVPTVVIMDYEFARWLPALHPTWVMIPDVIPDSAICVNPQRILRYPGIKEDVYVPAFKPDPSIKDQLGLDEESLIVTVRPPANEAHYHNPESETLFAAVMDLLQAAKSARAVLLPRNAKQAAAIRRSWSGLLGSGKVIIPEHALDGLNLMWHSDLVISGGGTMNREAAALGLPVYSIFRGSIGAVDRYLVDTGRLVLLESAQDVRTKLHLVKRQRPDRAQIRVRDALNRIVDHLVAILDSLIPSSGNHSKAHAFGKPLEANTGASLGESVSLGNLK